MNQLVEITNEALAEYAKKLSTNAPHIFVPKFLGLLEGLNMAKSEVYLPPPIAGREPSAYTRSLAAQSQALDVKIALVETIFVRAFKQLSDAQLGRFRGHEIQTGKRRIDMLSVLLQCAFVSKATRESIKILALSERPLEIVRLRQLLMLGLRNFRIDLIQIGLELSSDEDKRELMADNWETRIATRFNGIECDTALDYLRSGKISLKTAIAKSGGKDCDDSKQVAMQALRDISPADRKNLLRGLTLATTDECIQSAEDDDAFRMYQQLQMTLQLANFTEAQRITVFTQMKYGETIISKVAGCSCSGAVPWESSYDLPKLLECVQNIGETDWLLLKHIASARADLELVLNSFLPPVESKRVIDLVENLLACENPPTPSKALPHSHIAEWMPQLAPAAMHR